MVSCSGVFRFLEAFCVVVATSVALRI